jgi:hypothetical protein
MCHIPALQFVLLGIFLNGSTALKTGCTFTKKAKSKIPSRRIYSTCNLKCSPHSKFSHNCPVEAIKCTLVSGSPNKWREIGANNQPQFPSLAGIAGPHDLITAVCISPCKS